jgi:hypothetical protein
VNVRRSETGGGFCTVRNLTGGLSFDEQIDGSSRQLPRIAPAHYDFSSDRILRLCYGRDQ